ncbi:hypothetical protein B0H13DRAFT_2333720 [Mycena leptocephala]|nr:hypothetical protein B0H13DRAFT_2333720 [Mycena leptocephala]
MARTKEVQQVQQDVEDTVMELAPMVRACGLQTARANAAHSQVRNRWFHYKPESSGSKQQNSYSPMPSLIKELTASTSKRQKTKRAADENVFTLDSDSSESVQILSSPKKAKKRKRSLPAVDVSEDEDSVEMSFYLYVETPPPLF